ncbi:hypothetical protein NSERUTF1_6170 [Nocardia seriolae]|nr:hypothetical protein NSERUTF1_6170 [Nocardia seriolae]
MGWLGGKPLLYVVNRRPSVFVVTFRAGQRDSRGAQEY